MKSTILVMSTVHEPDDTRIRERLIRTLEPHFHVVYACREPGPTDTSGVEVSLLRGGRLRRNGQALGIALRGRYDLVVIHDPELIPTGLIARMVRRKTVVLDVHENIPATAMTRQWVPGLVRRPLAAMLRVVLRVVEKFLVVTLAEPGYQALFQQDHEIFVNYPDTSAYPDPVPVGNGHALYLGDVTWARGVDLAAAACRRIGIPFTVIGKVPQDMDQVLDGSDLLGRLPNPEAIRHTARCSVGLSPLRSDPNYETSLPTKVLEYLAIGIPVVASDLPGTRSLVQGLEGVTLVEPGDLEALADGIGGALSAESRAKTQSQAFDVRKRFAWPEKEVSAFYLSLV